MLSLGDIELDDIELGEAVIVLEAADQAQGPAAALENDGQAIYLAAVPAHVVQPTILCGTGRTGLVLSVIASFAFFS